MVLENRIRIYKKKNSDIVRAIIKIVSQFLDVFINTNKFVNIPLKEFIILPLKSD
jgi:hypothetical protein